MLNEAPLAGRQAEELTGFGGALAEGSFTFEAKCTFDEATSQRCICPSPGAVTTPKVKGKGQGPFSFELACTTARRPVALAPKDAAFTLKADGKRTISVPSSATCKVQETNLADGVKYDDTSGQAHDGRSRWPVARRWW